MFATAAANITEQQDQVVAVARVLFDGGDTANVIIRNVADTPGTFEKVHGRDDVSGRLSTYTLDQGAIERLNGNVRLYPHAGQPLDLHVGLPEMGSGYGDAVAPIGGIFTESTIWVRQLQGGYPVLPRRQVVAIDVDQAVTRRSYETTTEYLDTAFPVPSSIRRESIDHDTGVETTSETEISYYAHDTAQWLIGLPQQVTIHSATSGDAYAEGCTSGSCSESTVTVNYTYVPGSRLVDTATRTHGTEVLVTRNDYAEGGLLELQALEGAGQTRTMELSYDSSGSYVEGVENSLGHEFWALRDPTKGWTFAEVDENGARTIFRRDGFGRITGIQHDDGSELTYTYETGKVTEVSRSGAVSITSFNVRGLPVLSEWSMFQSDGMGQLHTTYSVHGVPRRVEYGTTTSAPVQIARTQYDRLGRIVSATNGLDEVTEYDYNAVLGVVDITDPKSNRTRTTTDVHGNVHHVTRFATVPAVTQVDTDYRYNEHGQLSAIVPGDLASGTIERMQYDALGRQISWTTDGILRLGTDYNAFGDADLVERDHCSSTTPSTCWVASPGVSSSAPRRNKRTSGTKAPVLAGGSAAPPGLPGTKRYSATTRSGASASDGRTSLPGNPCRWDSLTTISGG